MEVPASQVMISVLIFVTAFMQDAKAHNLRVLTNLIRRVNPRLQPRHIDVVSYNEMTTYSGSGIVV